MNYESIEAVVRELEQSPVERGGNVYHPVPFPEFSHLKTSANFEQVHAKLDLVRTVLRAGFPGGLAGVKILDVGANAGFFTFSLAADGADVTAYEPHPRYGPIGAYLAREKTTRVDWRPIAFDREAARRDRYDAALMLSTFQWITKGNALIDEGRALLRELSQNVGLLIFELGLNSGKSAVTTRRRNHIAHIYRLLRDSTTYPHVRLVGRTEIWKGGNRYVFVCSHNPLPIREPWYSFVKRVPL